MHSEKTIYTLWTSSWPSLVKAEDLRCPPICNIDPIGKIFGEDNSLATLQTPELEAVWLTSCKYLTDSFCFCCFPLRKLLLRFIVLCAACVTVHAQGQGKEDYLVTCFLSPFLSWAWQRKSAVLWGKEAGSIEFQTNMVVSFLITVAM